MSKTYNLSATLYTGRTKAQEENWTAFENTVWTDWVNNKGYAGKDGDWYYATAMQFDSSTLASIRNKLSNGISVSSITLEVNCTQAMTGESYISYKFNNTWSGNSNSAAWARSANGASSSSSGDSANAYTITAQSLSTGTKTFTLKGTSDGIPFSGVPVYGLVAGPRLSVNGRWRFSSATLHITTDETDYTYTLSYNANSGSGAPSSQSNTVTGGGTAPSMTFTISNTQPTRTGYTFLGWSTNQAATSASYQPGGTISISANTTLYAVWKAITYTIYYNANGGSGAPASQTKTYGVQLTVSATIPTRTGYTFLGWSTSSSATSATYRTGANHDQNIYYTTNAAATLYAVWQIITYTVSYNKGSNGTGTNTSDTKTYNVSLTLKGAIFTRTGYAQTGWATSDGGAQAYALSASYTANAAATLYPVWTATKSTVSTTNGTLGTAQTITINRQNSSYTHTLTYAYGNTSGTIATGVATSYSWTPSTSLAAQFPSAKSGTCTITCTTYSGSTSLGSTTTTCTLTIPSSVCCTVNSVTLAETVAGLASQFGGFVQGKSKVSVTGSISSGSGSPAYGATVSSYAITINGQTLTSNGATTSVLTSSGNNLSYSFKVTDSRGYSHTKSGTYIVLPYSSPSVSATIGRNSSDSSKIDISYSYSISSVNNHNTKGLSVKYKPVGGSYTTVSLTASNYSGSGTYQITGLDANTAYEVNVIAADYFGSVQTTTNVNPTGNRVFDISSTDKTLARHGSNPSDGWDHQYFNEQFHGVLDVTPRRCYRGSDFVAGAGWKRAMDINFNSLNDAKFAVGAIIDICIGSTYFDTNNMLRKITLNGIFENVTFDDEHSKSNNLNLIDKIRYTRDSSNHGHIDIHYNYSSRSYLWVTFDVHTFVDYQGVYVASDLIAVADSPSGETIVTEYGFIANTDRKITFTPSNCSVYRTCWFERVGNVCYLHIDIKDLTANTNTYIYTLPEGYRPADYVRLVGNGQESWTAQAGVTVASSGTLNVYSTDRYAIIDGSFICKT